MDNIFYVYGHFDDAGNCRYIGKGCKNRAYMFLQRSKRWYQTFSGAFPIVKIFESGLSEEQAFDREIFHISEQLKNNADLINVASGGYGKGSFDERSHKIFSEMRKGDKTWTFGKERPEETRRLISETKRNNPEKSIARYWSGRKRDPDLIKKMFIASQAPESKLKRYSKMIGRKLTEEHKEKIRLSLKKKTIICSNGEKYDSINDAARKTGLSCGRISEVANGKRKSAKGLIFSFGEKC
jgi:hypothetical protein